MTVPSACVEGTVIQSPTCSISAEVRRMPATRPSMVSLKTSIRMAEVAPRPANSVEGLRPRMMAMTTMTARKMTTTRSNPQNDSTYWRRLVR